VSLEGKRDGRKGMVCILMVIVMMMVAMMMMIPNNAIKVGRVFAQTLIR